MFLPPVSRRNTACAVRNPYEENQSDFFIQLGHWYQRQWKDLTKNPSIIIQKIIALFVGAAPFIAIDYIFPHLSAIVVLAAFSVDLFAPKSYGWALPHVYNCWAFESAYTSGGNLLGFFRTGSSILLAAALTDAAFASIFFYSARLYQTQPQYAMDF